MFLKTKIFRQKNESKIYRWLIPVKPVQKIYKKYWRMGTHDLLDINPDVAVGNNGKVISPNKWVFFTILLLYFYDKRPQV